MRQYDDNDAKGVMQSLKASLLMLTFGLSILAYLVAIERSEWLHIQPVSVSGTDDAMSAESSVMVD